MEQPQESTVESPLDNSSGISGGASPQAEIPSAEIPSAGVSPRLSGLAEESAPAIAVQPQAPSEQSRSKRAVSSPEDIPGDLPVAQRDLIAPLPAPRPPFALWMGGGIGAIALLAGGLLFLGQRLQAEERFEPMISITAPDPAQTADLGFGSDPSSSTPKTLLGHRAYDEAPEEDLVALTADGRIRLRAAAAESFQEMARAAAQAGVTLVPLSGFRSHQDQERIFFSIKAERGQSAQTRAEVSAPPGYSEHHTGYALDIGDGDAPATHLNTDFAGTEAYAWLAENAARYGFELSFPPGNPQGVAYEPWHWRFTGDRESLETFYQQQ